MYEKIVISLLQKQGLLSKLWSAGSKLSNSFSHFRDEGKHHPLVPLDEELRIK